MKIVIIFKNISLIFLGIFLALIVGEGLVRIATMNQENYIVEMWRYAKLLKQKSPDPFIGHQHIPNTSAKLQNVEIVINSLGLRGPEPNQTALHRVAIVGDSIALGWGVPENETLRGQLKANLSVETDVVNAGIGNMNLSQTVQLWKTLDQEVHADTLVVLVTPRSTATITTESPGWLIEHSQLAALASTFIQQMTSGKYGESALLEGYKQQWSSTGGQAILSQAFELLENIKREKNSHIIIVSIPESHDFNNYQFSFMEDITQRYAQKYGFDYVNPLPLLQGPPTSSFWASPNDIHPNGEAFQIISKPIIDKIIGIY